MRVVITRPQADSQAFADLLLAEGFAPISMPVIDIEPHPDTAAFKAAFSKLAGLDWLIFTSKNGVEVFFNQLKAGRRTIDKTTKIAAVGEVTAARVQSLGFPVAYVPEAYLGENITAGLGELSGRTVLLPTADIADPALPQALISAGANVTILTAYRTRPADLDPDALAAIHEGVDVITFTSGSAARNFFAAISRHGVDPLHLPNRPAVACIGPKTAAAAEGLGFPIRITADPYTVAGLVAAIVKFREEINQ